MPVCRVCLGRDRKLYDIELCNLKTSYETLTNCLLPEDGLSWKLCWECGARLLACARFREKALCSQALLAAMAPFNQYDIAQKLDSLDDQKLNLTSSLTAVHLGPLIMCTTCSRVDKDECVFVTGRGATEDALMQSHWNMLIKKKGNNESMNEVEYSDLYEEHEVKQDLVLGPMMLQPQDIAFGLAQQPETPAAVITRPKEEGEITKAHPVEEDIAQKLDSLDDQKLNLTSSLTAVHLGPLVMCTTCSRVDKDECVFVTGRGATEDALMQSHWNMLIKKKGNNESMNEVEYSDLYEEHEVKQDLVLGPMMLQPQDIAFGLAQQPETPAAVITRPKEEGEITKAHPVEEVQNTEIDPVGSQKNSDSNSLKYCTECNFTTIYKRGLELHEKIHTKEPYKCSACSYRCTRKENLLMHKRTHKPFKCSHCSYTSSYKGSLLTHERTHTGEKPYKCDICDYKAAHIGSLKEHLMSVHAGVKPFKCSHCSYTSCHKSHLLSHERTHTGDKPYKCDICDYKAAQRSSLKKHLMSVHAGVKPFKCSHCSYTSCHKSHLLSHERTHTGDKPYKCDICDYKAGQRSSLKNHLMSVHAGVKPFKCSHCSYTSSYKGSLLTHERTHTGEKPYKCDICDYKAAQTSTLKKHLMSVHTGVKPFKCRHCSYTNSRKCNMLTHERTHTGEKPYKCDICDYKAAHTSSLKLHLIRAHAGVKPFKCSHCSYASSIKTNFLNHERTHTGEKPYKCDTCNYRTAFTGKLKQHVKRIHTREKKAL